MNLHSILKSIVLAAILLRQTQVLQDKEQRLGPFLIGRQPFTVTVYRKRLGHSETMVALEIRDESDEIQYARTFPYEVRNGKFQRPISIAVTVTAGKPAKLLLQYRTKPASSQVFGLKDGKLVLENEY